MQEMEETQVRYLSQVDALEQGMETHSSILAWRIPWTEEPGGLQSTGLQTVGHDWSNLALTQHHMKVTSSHHIQYLIKILFLMKSPIIPTALGT